MGASDIEIISQEEFSAKFATEDDCLSFLASVKWGGGYECRKCGHTRYTKGRYAYSRRCSKCKNLESAKVGTIFEECRFALPKAFAIAYCVCHNQGQSVSKLSECLDLRHMTCWRFRKRLEECAAANKGSFADALFSR
jgi:two-component system, sensor histidine kinase LadS